MNISELILHTAHLGRTRMFYHKTLELPIVSESSDRISFRIGDSLLTFEETQEGKPFYHFAINITNNRFSDSFEWINRKLDILPAGHDMPIALYPNWNAQSFYFYDNNGSILEFIARFDLPYASSEPFGLQDLKEISEIGLVTPDVGGLVQSLEEQGIPHYRKGPRLPDFVAMGDEYGLLLVSEKGRGWVPVHKPAQVFPLGIRSREGLMLQF